MPAGGLDESAALTLMSTDIDRLTVSLANFCEIWARVIEMAIGIWLLERQIGWVCVAPIVLTVGQCFGRLGALVTIAYMPSSIHIWG
jgi:ATP-binding cassette subfamily C (CFTR/MRP) protein 1